jgi:hypothetical protein
MLEVPMKEVKVSLPVSFITIVVFNLYLADGKD